MSIQAMAWAIEQQQITDANARFVLVSLANCAGPTGENSFPSIKRICRDTGLSESSVRRGIRTLEKASMIIRGNQAIAAAYISRNDKRPVVYNLLMSGVSHRHPVAITGCQEEASGVSHRPERGVRVTPDPSRRSVRKPKRVLQTDFGAENQKRAEFERLLGTITQHKKV